MHIHTNTRAGQSLACLSFSLPRPSHFCVYCSKETPRIGSGTAHMVSRISRPTLSLRTLTGIDSTREKWRLHSSPPVGVQTMRSILTLSSLQEHHEVIIYSTAVDRVDSLRSFIVTNGPPLSSLLAMLVHNSAWHVYTELACYQKLVLIRGLLPKLWSSLPNWPYPNIAEECLYWTSSNL